MFPTFLETVVFHPRNDHQSTRAQQPLISYGCIEKLYDKESAFDQGFPETTVI